MSAFLQSIRTRGVCAACFALMFFFVPSAGAQTPVPGTPAQEIQRQLDASGLRALLQARITASGKTPQEVRRRLAVLGYDSTTLDPYLAEPPATGPDLQPSATALEAARALGLSTDGERPDARPAPAAKTPEEIRSNLRVFGTEVFDRTTSEFDPVIAAALPSTYALGPGDELVLVISGDVEYSHMLPVTREGFILIPQVGQVWVNGLTLSTLREQLYTRLGNVYSGVTRGAGATTKFDISIARTRTNQVFISGDVTRPGSYSVSPLASVLNALYQAGGPTSNGSFRNVQVMRSGKLVRDVDLYSYLLSGNSLSDVRLENGDVIFVPVHGTHVTILGEVARPAIYELRPGETVADLLAYAGGLNAPAQTRRARLTRILPTRERTQPGVDRIVRDIDLEAAMADSKNAAVLRSGDEIEVLALRSDVRQSVSLEGSVWREGSFGYRPGMRVWDLIRSADGLTTDAYPSNAQITRLKRADGSVSVIAFSLETGPDGQPRENPELQEDDIVRIFSRSESSGAFSVTVEGAVKRPFTETFERGMTLRDAIVRAGGLRYLADPVVVISRVAEPQSRASGKMSEIIKVRVDSTFFVSEEAAAYYVGMPDSLRRQVNEKSSGDFVLKPFDRIVVRMLPDYEMPRVVTLLGEVQYPGSYTLARKDERVADVIVRSGGLTRTSYPEGFRLTRNGHVVDIDLPDAMKNRKGRNNVILMPGDSLSVPEYNPVVIVLGAVNTPTAVLHRKGAPTSYYIESAGGYTDSADKDRVHVRFANGRSKSVHRYGLLIHTEPTPEPGSVVTVPVAKPNDGADLRGLLSDFAQITAALGTIALVVFRVQ